MHARKHTHIHTRTQTHTALPDYSLIPFVYSCAGHHRAETVTHNQIALSHVVIQTACLKKTDIMFDRCVLYDFI